MQGDRRVEFGNREADVVDTSQHGCESTVGMRLALIANAASGGGLDVDALAHALRAEGAEVGVHGCDAEDVEAARRSAPDRIAVAGGDGTIGPAAEAAGALGVPLAVVPAGTANDFARANGLPVERRAACRLAVRGERTRPLELGRLADGRPFVNVASAGLASVAARRAQPLKPRLGPLAYAVGAARAALTGRPLPARVRADGREVFAGDGWQVIVAVTGAFGGGSGVGASDPDDGVLDVVVIRAGTRIGLVRRAWGLRRHTIAEQRGVPHHRARVVEVLLPPGTEFNVDGEVRDHGMERMTVRARAFALVVPDDRRG
jgi:diacylglycerol kinase (ATP)